MLNIIKRLSEDGRVHIEGAPDVLRDVKELLDGLQVKFDVIQVSEEHVVIELIIEEEAKAKEELLLSNVGRAGELLRSSIALFRELNTDYHQVDYCTRPQITNVIDYTVSSAKKLELLWYQEKR